MLRPGPALRHIVAHREAVRVISFQMLGSSIIVCALWPMHRMADYSLQMLVSHLRSRYPPALKRAR